MRLFGVLSLLFASVNALDVLFHASCDFTAELLPNKMGALSGDSGEFAGAFQESIKQSYLKSAAANCDVPASQINELFTLDFGSFLRSIDASAALLPKLPDCHIFNWGDVGRVNLPDTCTHQRFMAGQGCDVSMNLLPGLNIDVSVKSCPNHGGVSTTVACRGPGCGAVLAPCHSNLECGLPWTCSSVHEDFTGDFLRLRNSGLFAATDDIEEMSQALVSKVIKVLSQQIGLAYQETNTFATLGFCGINEFQLDECHNDVTSVTTCPWLVAHDGSSTAGATTPQHAPWRARSGNRYPLLTLDCNANLQFMHQGSPLFPSRVAATGVPNLLTSLTTIMKELNRNGPNLDTFSKDYQIWNPQFWMNIFSEDAPGRTLASWLDMNINLDSGYCETPCQVIPPFVNIEAWPSTCSPQRMIDEGACDFQIDLSPLVRNFPAPKNAASISVSVRVCPETGHPAVNVDCVGGFCEYLTNPVETQACTEGASSCSPGYTCQEFSNVEVGAAFAIEYFNRVKGQTPPNSNSAGISMCVPDFGLFEDSGFVVLDMPAEPATCANYTTCETRSFKKCAEFFANTCECGVCPGLGERPRWGPSMQTFVPAPDQIPGVIVPSHATLTVPSAILFGLLFGLATLW